MKKLLIIIAALCVLLAACSGSDEQNSDDEHSGSEAINQEVADGGPASATELHAQLVAADMACDQPEEYSPGEGELDFGMAPTHTFDCEGGALSAAVFSDETERASMQDVVAEMTCSFGFESAFVAHGNWWIADETMDGGVNLLERAGNALGHPVDQPSCD